MTDLTPNPDSTSDTRVGPSRGSTYSTPRWVKVSGIIVLVLILLIGIILLTGVGGDHGPGRHMPSGDAGGHASPGGAGETPSGDGGDTPFGSYTLPYSVTEKGAQYL